MDSIWCKFSSKRDVGTENRLYAHVSSVLGASFPTVLLNFDWDSSVFYESFRYTIFVISIIFFNLHWSAWNWRKLALRSSPSPLPPSLCCSAETGVRVPDESRKKRKKKGSERMKIRHLPSSTLFLCNYDSLVCKYLDIGLVLAFADFSSPAEVVSM